MEKRNNICQSCAMMMKGDDYGTNADGSVNEDYCKYCFSDGQFKKNETMEERIEDDIRFWIDDTAKPRKKPARK